MKLALEILLLGAGATALMDAATFTLQRIAAVPAPNYTFVGRWVGHMAHGQFRHASIAAAPPVRGEAAIGWATHYAVGIAFAAVLVGIAGAAWLHRPTALPAVLVGLATVLSPFLVMQPAMGLGVAAAKAPHPATARLRSLLNHFLFGVGLYLAGLALALRTTF